MAVYTGNCSSEYIDGCDKYLIEMENSGESMDWQQFDRMIAQEQAHKRRLFDNGYKAFYTGVSREEISDADQLAGWDEAEATELHFREIEREEAQDAYYRRWGMG